MPAFYGKGKVKPKSMALKDDKCVDIFSNFGSVLLSQSMFKEIEIYVCCMYSFKNRNNLNDVIENIFEEKLKPAVSSNPLDTIKSVDLPKVCLSKIILDQHNKRAWFIARLYKSAATAHPTADHTPTDFGVELREN